MPRGQFRIAAFAVAFLAAGVSLAAQNDVLYWMVDDTAKINRWWESSSASNPAEIQDYFDDYTSPANSYFAARIRVTGGSISGDTILSLYSDGGTEMDGTIGVEFYENGGYWGAGVPTGTQSPSGEYSAGSPEYSFIVEIGNVVYDSQTGDPTSWTTVATSAAYSYNDFSNYIVPIGSVNPPAAGAWTPVEFNAVPEPSGGLLTLLGLAVLALRRNRPDEEA